MEISATGRLEVRITPADVGKRVSVRRLGEPGAGPEKFTDTVGVLTSWDGGVLMITRRDGERVRIPETALVAGKVIPAAPARRRGPAASYPELARVTARAWPPVESEPLGDWELRAAAGFTRRANSVLPLGHPGLGLDAALDAVRGWYGERGLPARVQTATGAEGTQELLCAELERRGWVREVTAELWTGALAPVADRAGGTGVVLSRTADEAWLARYRRKGMSEAALRVLHGGPSVWFAAVPGAGAGEPPTAIGRCVVDGRWAGFAAVEVDPSRRREGLATEVMAALARRALDEGASAAWLQVETDNEGARSLYRTLGFLPHHTYHHYRAPELPATPDVTPDVPAAPAAPDRTPEEPAASGQVPEAPAAPAASGNAPHAPATPATPDHTPRDPATSAVGRRPEGQAAPATAGRTPHAPATPATPDRTPQDPATPATPDRTPQDPATPAVGRRPEGQAASATAGRTLEEPAGGHASNDPAAPPGRRGRG
ncbi:hypothetical protein Srubr_53690 [Streptomyces rubradiris]|uniref:N-acetyltransferase domain-containing protein n=1 Tax=Streptomyces rubradiris TaxID=285531 RepID=A0ABQ3RI35_STRRR|nr:hypothetical protein GCM10018792_55630 [Streptomyces rubradiris]GHI55523.1 hypothetical protein Srubr_53690 [Streptomyces rubradiris]